MSLAFVARRPARRNWRSPSAAAFQAMSFTQVLVAGHTVAETAQDAVTDSVDPAMDLQFPTGAPSRLHDRVARHVIDLGDDIELHQHVLAGLFVRQFGEPRGMPLAQITQMAQPVIEQPEG